MRKLVVIVIAILLGASALYATEVNTISLRYAPNQTIATIHVDGQVRVTHQTEVPKDGKGHRVIIDLLAATHNLASSKFDNLPDCMIKSIRSSQYATTPEQITRIVFDVDRAPIYRIETDQQSVTVYFTDQDVKQFVAWNSKLEAPAPVQKPPVKVASAKTETVVSKPMASAPVAQSQPTETMKVESQPTATKPVVVKPTVVASKPATQTEEKPAVTATQPKPTTPVATRPTSPKAVDPATSKPDVATSQAPAKVVAKATPAQPKATETPKSTEDRPVVVVADNNPSKAPETTLVTETTKKMPLKSEMKASEESASKASTQQAKPTMAKNDADDKKSTEIAQAAKPEPAKPSTSRFRRNPGDAAVSGTMVVEFPKRLVIKYKGTSYRDPFETLINASRSTNNPIEKQVPNIDGLRLVGVIESDSRPDRALFEDTDGFGYILKTGDKVRNGYVLRVDRDKVYFQIFEYGWSRTVALQLEN